MTASEFAFLALGLVLGVASGAALSIVIRARPPAPREVRVTVSPDALPRRSSMTLSGLGTVIRADAARGGPADPEILGSDEEVGTPVRSGVPARAAVGIPVRPGADAWSDALGLGATGPMVAVPVVAAVAAAVPVLVPVRAIRADAIRADAIRADAIRADAIRADAIRADALQADALQARAADTTAEAAPTVPVRAGRAAGATAVAGLPAPTVARADGDDLAAHAGGTEPPSPRAMSDTGALDPVGDPVAGVDPCGAERRQVEERSALADRLREEATLAAARVSAAQRAYDDHQSRADAADATASPRALLTRKEAAWQRFREVNGGAHSPEMGEAAARDWLQEIDRINRAAQDAASEARREREEANALVTVIERLSLEADAARINAESAGEACDVARETLAACEESDVDRQAGRVPMEQSDQSGAEGARAWLVGGPELEPGELVLDPDAAQRVFGDHEPAILKLLRGDRETMQRLVAALAGDDPAQQRRWQLGLSGLVDAVVARAIEASALEFPEGHPFWRPFSQGQSRDIATALASLGYRFDGLGGFADARIPSQRDLSLAVGYAGLDPMRIRQWPSEAEMAGLYRDVTVSAGEYLAGAASELTLGEMVAMLHGRAEELRTVWDSWARLRPMLLKP